MEQTTAEWLTEEIKLVTEKMAHTLNGRMKPELYSIDDEHQTLTLKFPTLDWEVNGLGTLHGGMINTMLDLTMCMVVYCYSRETIPPTVSMTTNYLRPVPMDGSVLIEAQLTSCGKRNATAIGKAIVPATGKVACTSIGTYAIVKKPQ